MLVAPGQPNGQGQGAGAGAWAERWDKGEGAMGGVGTWVKGGQGLGSRGSKGFGQGGILISPRNILRVFYDNLC